MSSGRPVFTQETEAEELEDPQSEATTPPVVESQERQVKDPIGNRLKFSSSYSRQPYVTNQDRLYPDTVKVVGERYYSFEVSNPEQMQSYSDMRLSNAAGSTWKITSEEVTQWHEAKGTWLITFRVQERMFKTTQTNQQDPDEP